uniref:Uncharacterized protein n=1 Tax=Ananas comosus var. bracteatus TaxID=296719 RepID=A0A6V7Q3V2_ANACO|nr:unnamed protein product [Ananas comosus var. bracteatus]
MDHKNTDSLAAFYTDVTGINLASLDGISLNKIVDLSDMTEFNEDTEQKTCPFSWARSLEKLLQQDTYLALASAFVLLRLLSILVPKLNVWANRAWRRRARFASLISFWIVSKAYIEQAKQGFNKVILRKRSNLLEGAMNAGVWASKSLASVATRE